MADDKSKKPGGKTGEMLLGILGALGSVAGPLLTGEDIDFGLPFKLGSQYLQNQRMEDDLVKALESTPHTAGLAQEIGDTINQGGLPAVLQNMGQGQLNIASAQPQQASPVDMQPALQQLSPVPSVSNIPAQQSVEMVPPDVNSPEFLQILSKFRPDLAEKVLVSQATQGEGDPINTILKTLALQNYQSPEMKRQAGLEDTAIKSQIIEDRQQRTAAANKELEKQAQREKWTAGETKFLMDSDAAINNSRFLLDRVKSGIQQNVLSAVLGKSPITARIGMELGAIDKAQVQEFRDILKMVMTAVRTQSGVQYGFRELQWIKSSQPSEWDTPEMFKRGVTMALNTQLWNKYGVIIRKAERAGNAEVALREGMTPEQIKAWKVLDAQLAKRATSDKKELNVFSDPKNKVLLDTLGMGMIPSIQSSK